MLACGGEPRASHCIRYKSSKHAALGWKSWHPSFQPSNPPFVQSVVRALFDYALQLHKLLAASTRQPGALSRVRAFSKPLGNSYCQFTRPVFLDSPAGCTSTFISWDSSGMGTLEGCKKSFRPSLKTRASFPVSRKHRCTYVAACSQQQYNPMLQR